ncbi:hypothetical protein E2320_017902 [Naja naja]|nr:hypothetical protein E2320_017902 [Naja naja]
MKHKNQCGKSYPPPIKAGFLLTSRNFCSQVGFRICPCGSSTLPFLSANSDRCLLLVEHLCRPNVLVRRNLGTHVQWLDLEL